MSRRPVIAQARVLRRIRAGEEVREAMTAEGYSPKTTYIWRKRYPDFRAGIDQAKHDRRAMAPEKHAFLTALAQGGTIYDAARVAGVNWSAGCNWSREYPGFAAAYKRLTGQREAARRAEREARREAFFTALDAGQSIQAAAATAGIDGSTPYRWKSQNPEFYARFRAIVEERVAA